MGVLGYDGPQTSEGTCWLDPENAGRGLSLSHSRVHHPVRELSFPHMSSPHLPSPVEVTAGFPFPWHASSFSDPSVPAPRPRVPDPCGLQLYAIPTVPGDTRLGRTQIHLLVSTGLREQALPGQDFPFTVTMGPVLLVLWFLRLGFPAGMCSFCPEAVPWENSPSTGLLFPHHSGSPGGAAKVL